MSVKAAFQRFSGYTGILGRDSVKSLLVNANSFRNASTGTFRAVVCVDPAKPLEIQEVKRKGLTDAEVRIKIHSAAVNVKDVACIHNHGYRYLYSGKPPFTPGFEFCGEVLEVGSKVKRFSVGERVICLNHEHLGGFAEECVASMEDCWGIDQDVSFETGAALLESYATALIAFGHRHKLRGGEKEVILVTAAAGGLGLAAVDVASNVFKTKVIALCATEKRASEMRDFGAWSGLTYTHEHLVAKVKEVTEGNGVDVVFDAVGGPVFDTALQCVKNEGTVIIVAFASGKVPRVAAHHLFPHAPTVTGVSLPHYRAQNPKLFKHMCNEAVELNKRGLISPRVSYRFPLSQVNEAIATFSDAQKTGKILITLDLKDEEKKPEKEAKPSESKEKK